MPKKKEREGKETLEGGLSTFISEINQKGQEEKKSFLSSSADDNSLHWNMSLMRFGKVMS